MNIPHEIISWVKDFLNGGSFQVSIDGITSSKKNISAGVLQGSVLGPTLFSIFINDIPISERSNISNSLLFADYLASFFKFRKATTAIKNKIKRYLKSIEDGLKKLHLLMSPNKFNYIIF